MNPKTIDPLDLSPYLKEFLRPGVSYTADYYAYNTSGTITAGGALDLTIETQSDSDFIVTGLSANETGGAGGPTTIQITDRGSGKTLFNQATLTELVCGNGGFPFILASPRVFMPNSNILISLRSLSTRRGTQYVTLLGVRIYYETAAGAIAAGTPNG